MNTRIERIAYADDDEDDHFFFSQALAEALPAVKLITFYNCLDLLKFLQDEKHPFPDVIFLDYNMPGNNSSSCLRLIKNNAKLRHIPVIVYSTSNYRAGAGEALSDGAYKYVIKKHSINDISAMLRDIVAELESN